MAFRLHHWGKAAALALAALLLTEGLWQQGALQSVDDLYQDAWFKLAGPRHAVERIALVKLDEATLAQYPDEPLVFWGPHFAQAIQTLQAVGVTVVGIDLLLSSSPEQWLAKLGGVPSLAARQFDQPLRQALATGRVVVAGMQSSNDTLLPASDYLAALPDWDIARFVGAADLQADADGVLRAYSPTVPLPLPLTAPAPELRLRSLPFLLALHASGQAVQGPTWQFAGRTLSADERLRLAYAGPPGTVPSVSMGDLLRPDALALPQVQALRGKVVILGASYSGMNDVHITPYGRGLGPTPLMLGMEIQAQTVEALLQGQWLDAAPASTRLGWALLLLLPASLFWWQQRLWRGLLLCAVLWLLVAGLSYGALGQHRLLSSSHPQLATLLGFMAIYAWRFTHGERERQRIRLMFSRYLEPRVVEALIHGDRMPQLGGERCEMTVLFTDIRNFTTISEQLSPEEVVEMLNHYFSAACAVLTEQGACIDKFIGDAIMAEFGAPLKNADHAHRALTAALHLRTVAEHFGQWMQQRFADRTLPPFRIGIGIHTGMAISGNIGTAQRMEYTAIGDTVNIASRLESMTKTLGCVILASQDTLQAAGPGFVLGRSDTITVRGRTQPTEVFEIIAMKEAA